MSHTKKKLFFIIDKFGLNKSIAYSSGARVVSGVAGVVSVFFIASFLSKTEQGFYYTFSSLLALQIFFELGLTSIMTQYVSYEASHLKMGSEYQYEGENKYLSRLSSLVSFCIKWYSLLSIIVFIFLCVLGSLFFERYYSNSNDNVSWRLPWILVCAGTAIKLFQSPLNSILMGLGFVKEVSKITFYQQLIPPIVIWIGLICGLKLYVTGIGYLLSVLLWGVYAWNTRLLRILINILRNQITEKVYYFKEIFPYQWRIAISWVSGYFIYQLFNPVLFATEGPIVAGQMGISLQAINAIIAFSYSWINTKVPLYSSLIAKKEYNSLDSIFNQTLKQEVLVCALLIAMLFAFLFFCRMLHIQLGDSLLADRFLDYFPILMLAIPAFLMQFINSWATYLRCHKKEPFLAYSVIAAVLNCISTFLFGKMYGLYGITIGYCIISLILFPWGRHIYIVKKREWHK